MFKEILQFQQKHFDDFAKCCPRLLPHIDSSIAKIIDTAFYLKEVLFEKTPSKGDRSDCLIRV